MFTGIVEGTGAIADIQERAEGIRLVVSSRLPGRVPAVGASVALNGCCLTLVKSARKGAGRLLHFDLLKETWNRTSFQFARVGTLVNLERPLRGDSELGGHFVTGHVDGVGRIARWEK